MYITYFKIGISFSYIFNFTLLRVHVPVIKPTRCTNFSNLLWNKTVHVLDSSSVHHQEFSTVHTAIGICHTGLLTACEQDQDGTNVPS